MITTTGNPSFLVADDSPSQQTDEWQSMYLGKTRVGFIRTVTSTDTVDGKTLISSKTETAMTIARFGQKIKMRVVMESVETSDGEWVSFASTMENPPSMSTRTEGTVDGEKLTVKSLVGGRETVKTQAWDRSLKSPSWQDRDLREKPLATGESRTFKTYEPQFGKPITVTITSYGKETVELQDGRKVELNKMGMTQSIDPKLVNYSYTNDDNKTIKTLTKMLGTEMITWAVSKEEALKELSGEDVDLAIASMIKTGKIANSLDSHKVVYKITIADDDPAKYVAVGETQSIKRIDDHTIELTVISVAPPTDVVDSKTTTDGKFLQSNKLLQADDTRVVIFATEAKGDATVPGIQATQMEKWVAKKIKNKNFSTLMASAAEVAKTLSGDCTEHACLLSAMLRAEGIPSRVAVGLMYVPRDSAFGGHMWSEAFLNGKWVPLDGTLGRGRVGADHIKFADASFDDADGGDGMDAFVPIVSALGQMKIEVLEAE